MKIYSLTKLGNKITKNVAGGGTEMQVLQYLRNNETATEDQLEVVGGERWMVKKLKSEGLVKELTS